MPSCLPGFASGGQAIVSGNPFSGTISPLGGVQLKVAVGISGLVYAGVLLGLSSGGITQTSGGAFSSGGLSDGIELANGDAYFVPRLLCSGNVDKIAVVVPPTVSGTMRVFWELV